MADATDTAASILAPPDPTWNPPPTAVPDAVANPQQPTQTPLQGTPESVDVNSSDPTSVQPPSPALTSTIPSETPPNNPDVERHYHEGKLHHVLGRIAGDVASTLTGPETWHITRDPKTGDVSAVQQPSTLGEKWGRIAATALGGLAAGLQNAQGPGGFARAAGAGIQSGLQQPQQQQQQAQQQADFDNKQLMFKANHVALDQKIIQNAEAMRQQNITFAEGQADRLNAIQKDRALADGYEDVGDFEGVKDLPSFTTKFPQALKGHTVSDGKYVTFDPIIDPKTGRQTGSHVGLMSQAMGEQPMRNPPPIPQSYYDPETKSIQTRLINPVSGTKRNDYEAAVKKQISDNSELAIKVAGLDKEKTPEERAAALAEVKARTGAANAARDKDQFEIGKGPQGSALVDAIASGHITIDRLGYLAARNPALLMAVTDKDPTFDSSKAAAYPAVYKDFTNTKPGTAGGAINAGATAFKHLLELDGLNNSRSHIPGTPEYTAYQNKLDTVAPELAKFYGDTTIPAIDALKSTLGSTLPHNRHAAITTQSRSMGDKMDSYEQQWLNAAPSKAYEAPMPGIDQKAKEARAALDPDYRTRLVAEQNGGAPPPPPPPPPAAGGAAAAPPAGAAIKWPNNPPPQGEKWVVIPGQPVGHVPANKLPDFIAKHPNAQVQP